MIKSEFIYTNRKKILEELSQKLIEQSIEIERLKKDIKRITEITNQKIKIINDVREYMKKTIEDDGEYPGYKSMYTEDYYKLLEILEGNEIDEKI